MKSSSLILFCVAAIFVLFGCSTTEYKDYADAQSQINVARANAEKSRYDALSLVAQSGSETAKIAAVMALALGGNNMQGQAPQVQAPQPNQALQWASIVFPAVTNIAGMRYSYLSNVVQSNNSASVAMSTNNSFVGIAGKIQSPTIPQANITNTTTTTIGANSGSNSGNSGRIAGTTMSDATSTPTVVNQPAPVIVTQPTPIIVPQPTPIVVPQPAPIIVNQPPVTPAKVCTVSNGTVNCI